MVPVVLLGKRGMRRWSVLTVWVVEAILIMDHAVTATLVVAVRVPLMATWVGELVMTGRVARLPSALKRYGGL